MTNIKMIPFKDIQGSMLGDSGWIVTNDSGIEQICPFCRVGLIHSDGCSFWCNHCEKAWVVCDERDAGIRENIQAIRDENHDSDGTPNPFIHDAVSTIETCVDLMQAEIRDLKDQLSSCKGETHRLDAELKAMRLIKRALELAVDKINRDTLEFVGGIYETIDDMKGTGLYRTPDDYINLAKQEATDENRTPAP